MWTASPQGHGQIQHMFDSETLWALSCQRETPLLMFKLYLVPYLTPQCHLTERILQGAVIYLKARTPTAASFASLATAERTEDTDDVAEGTLILR